MEFTIKIEQSDFESVVEQRVKEAVARSVKDTVDRQVSKFEDRINDAVAVYLEKRITTEEVKNYIDKIIEERLRNLD